MLLAHLDLPSPATSPRQIGVASWAHGGPRLPSGPLRVLEIGAGAGANLLPLAFYDREGQYVGLDDDEEQVSQARAAAAELQIGNVRFEAPILGDRVEGGFDVVVIRDLYARVTDAARVEILKLAASVVTPGGLVLMDYPVMPGGGHQALARELVSPFAGGGEGAVREKAKALVGLLARSEHPYPNLLARELTRAAEAPLPELVGEYLRGAPAAFFHREVAARAGDRGLRFVCDAEFNKQGGFTPEPLRDELLRIGLTGVDLDQAADILCHRSARSSVFCRAEHEGSERLDPRSLDQLFIASPLAPVNDPPKLDMGAEELFATPLGMRMGSADTLFKACLMELRRCWPAPVSFAELVGGAVTILHESGAEGEPSDDQIAGVAVDLFTLYHRGMVDLHPAKPTIPAQSGRRLHALARREVRSRTALTTPMHTLLPFQGFEAALVKRMGTEADEDALVSALVAAIVSGEVPLEIGGARVTDPLLLTPMAKGLVNRAMLTLGSWGLLEG